MKRAGKIIGLVLSVLLLVTAFLPGGALAAPKGHGWDVKGKFKDVGNHWAKAYIEQMAEKGILKGVSEDRFEPEAPVERAQVLAMLVRALGLEDEALAEEHEDEDEDLAGVPAWARGYARVAAEMGIVTREELKQWKPGQKATRLEVAQYLAKLLADKVDAKQFEEFKGLSFKDLAGVPAHLRVYVLIVANNGIMTGDGSGYWLPYGLVNRGQMAKILALIVGRLPSLQPARQVSGQIKSVYQDDEDDDVYYIKLEGGNEEKEYVLAADCTIKLDGEAIDADELLGAVRDLDEYEAIWGQLTLNADEEVTEVRARTKVVVEGTITAIDAEDQTITVEPEDTNDEIEFAVTDATVIKVRGTVVRTNDPLNELAEDDVVQVKGSKEDDGYVAEEIDVRGKEDTTGVFEGTVVARVTDDKRPTITIEDEDDARYTFRVRTRAEVRLNGERADLEDVEKGDQVKVWVENGEAYRIEATEPQEEVSGEISALLIGTDSSLTVKVGSKLYTYKVTEDTEVFLDDEESTLNDLEPGWQVELVVRGEVALKIEAETPDE